MSRRQARGIGRGTAGDTRWWRGDALYVCCYWSGEDANRGGGGNATVGRRRRQEDDANQECERVEYATVSMQ